MRMPGEVVIDMGKPAPVVDDGRIIVDRDGRGPLRDIFQSLADLGERRGGLGDLVMIEAAVDTQFESLDEFLARRAARSRSHILPRRRHWR